MSKQKASELGKGHAEPLSAACEAMLQQEASELGKGHAEPILCFVSPCGGYVRRRMSMSPWRFTWHLKVTRVSVLSLKSVLTLLGRVPAPLQSSPLPYLWKRRGSWGMLAEKD